MDGDGSPFAGGASPRGGMLGFDMYQVKPPGDDMISVTSSINFDRNSNVFNKSPDVFSKSPS